MNIEPRTAKQVKDCLNAAEKTGAAVSMARTMVKFGNLTDDAREYARTYWEENK